MPRKPREPEPQPTFFLDRSLGREEVPSALRGAGAVVELHDDHYPPKLPDPEWLADAGRRGWAVISKDKRIMRREVERRSLEDADVAAFFLTAGALSGAEMGAALVAALPRMLHILAKYRRPIIATVSRSGTVEVKVGERRGGPKAQTR